MTTAVFFHAHPDDEAIATGGTMARLASEGHRVILITATGGELGEVPEGFLDPGETLTERRRKELDLSCEVLGVARHEFLGYRDSGMEGEATNNDASAFCQADLDEAAQRLADILVAEDATVLVDYDERGGYGHPDHVMVHRVGERAAELAGTSRYMATINRDHVLRLASRSEEFGVEGAPSPEQIENLGMPEDRITAAVDVSAFLDRKRLAMKAHASQISETSFFLTMDESMFASIWGTEWYIKAGAPTGAPLEDMIIPEASN